MALENQLRTIKLNPTPLRGVNGAPYKATPVKTGKTVLLVDDICTEGNSFEAGRTFIRATGADTICLSWLKTINTNYHAIAPQLKISAPYAPFVMTAPIQTRLYGYGVAINIGWGADRFGGSASPLLFLEMAAGYLTASIFPGRNRNPTLWRTAPPLDRSETARFSRLSDFLPTFQPTRRRGSGLVDFRGRSSKTLRSAL